MAELSPKGKAMEEFIAKVGRGGTLIAMMNEVVGASPGTLFESAFVSGLRLGLHVGIKDVADARTIVEAIDEIYAEVEAGLAAKIPELGNLSDKADETADLLIKDVARAR